MTSLHLATLRNKRPLAAPGPQQRATAGTSRRGFSIVELMAVVGIVVVLMTILVTVITKTQRAGANARAKADLAVIAQALDQYANDFKGMYPMSRDANTGMPVGGEHLLARALIGPGPEVVAVPGYGRVGDGYESTDWTVARKAGKIPSPGLTLNETLETFANRNVGFRTVPGGVPHNAYLDAGKFKPKLINTPLGWQWEILDHWGTPIAYLPRRIPSKSATAPLYGFDPGDMVGLIDGLEGATSQVDGNRAGAITGSIASQAGDTLRQLGGFILISAGSEKTFTGLPPTDKKHPNLYNFDR